MSVRSELSQLPMAIAGISPGLEMHKHRGNGNGHLPHETQDYPRHLSQEKLATIRGLKNLDAPIDPGVVEWLKGDLQRKVDITTVSIIPPLTRGDSFLPAAPTPDVPLMPFITDPTIAFHDVFKPKETLDASVPPEHIELAMFSSSSPEFFRYVQQMYGLPDNFWRDEGMRNKIVDATTPPQLALLARELGNDTPVYIETAKRVDEYFYSMYAKRFGLPYETAEDLKAVEVEYFKQQRHASEAVNEIVTKLIPHLSEYVDERTEIILNNRRPSDILHYLFSRDVSPALRFELQRQMILTHISSEIEAVETENVLGKALKRMQDMFDVYLFNGKISEVLPIVQIYALHRTDTNEVAEIVDGSMPQDQIDQGLILKRYPYRMRSVVVAEETSQPQVNTTTESITRSGSLSFKNVAVQSSAKPKERKSAIIKVLRRGIEEEQDRLEKGNEDLSVTINPAKTVPDLIRMRFVVNGDSKDLSLLRNKVRATIRNSHVQEYIGTLKPHPNDIVDDSRVNGTADQSDHLDFQRDQIHIEGLGQYLEIQYYTVKGHIDSKHEVGEKRDGRWTGSSFDTWHRTRMVKVLPYVFPSKFYGNIGRPDYFIEEARSHIDSVAEQQRRSFNADPSAS